jgi:hypothetical protein
VAAWRKTADADPAVLETTPEPDPLLRNEVDPDPLIEEMVGRLREGLSSMVAVDEWGRPLAWRNVVRLALGSLAGRLRDTEQALEIAVSMIPPTAEDPSEEPAPQPLEAPAVLGAPIDTVESPIEAVAEVLASHDPVAHAATEDQAAEAPVHDPDAPDVPSTQATVDVILPASEAVSDQPVEPAATAEVSGHAILVEEAIFVDLEPEAAQPAPAPVAQPAAVPTVRMAGATSLFTVSGDQRSVAVSPLNPGELLSGRRADDTTAAKYDRFLTGLYGERKQMSADEDRRSRSTGLSDDL